MYEETVDNTYKHNLITQRFTKTRIYALLHLSTKHMHKTVMENEAYEPRHEVMEVGDRTCIRKIYKKF